MTQKILQQGAEAKIFLDEKENLIIKDRISKSYRIKELDEKIRKQRTKKEKNLLEKASKIINAPNPLPLKEWNIIKMPFIDGKKLSEYLDSFLLEKQKDICRIIGQDIAKLHDADIIHGDLTTSNMILVDDDKKIRNVEPNLKISSSLTDSRRSVVTESDTKQSIASDSERIYFIDFGLGYISRKIEDKAVDLHLLKQALEARHFEHWQILFNEVIKGYEKGKEAKKVIERLKAVEKRGRYKEH